MIRINLLPSGRKKSSKLPAVFIYGAVGAVILILVLAALTFYINNKVSAMEDAIFTKEKKLKELKATLEEVKNYERDNREFREKARIIEQLKRNQTIPLRLLDEVSGMLPKGVWLTNLKDSKGVVSIKGYAFSNAELVNYVQNLKRSRYLKDIMLVESRQGNIEDFSVYSFKMTFKINL